MGRSPGEPQNPQLILYEQEINICILSNQDFYSDSLAYPPQPILADTVMKLKACLFRRAHTLYFDSGRWKAWIQDFKIFLFILVVAIRTS
jgi:hypothetical protein